MNILRKYLILVLIFSMPFWIAAQFFDATKIIPVKLPFSALQFLAVILAAVIVTRGSGKSVHALLMRGFDFACIKSRWRLGIFILMPLVVFASYGLMVLLGKPVSTHLTPLLSLPVFLLIYGVSGYCEQLGWTAIMTDALLARSTVIKTGLLTGVVWASWHIIPFIQTHNTATWIMWQCTFTIIYRVMMTKIYVITNRSLFATVALHATYNAAFSLLPYYGSSYNPMYMALATLAATIFLFMGEGTVYRKLAPSAHAKFVPKTKRIMLWLGLKSTYPNQSHR
jgi:hypothetical protein